MTVKETGLPCPKCDSSDALAVYEEGNGYCFSCKTYFHADQLADGGTGPERQGQQEPANDYAKGDIPAAADVPVRKLTKATLEYFGVGVEYDTTNGEQKSLTIPVYQKGEHNGNKHIGLTDKTFAASGSTKSPDMFGAKQAGEGGKLLIITEGEIDCMSARQMLMQAGKQYNVVSLPNGANVAAVRKNLEWVESFETVTLNLDNDEVGRACAAEIADILTPGKVQIMSLPVKDASDYLKAGATGTDYLKALWKAKPYRPDGVVALLDSWDLMWSSDQQESVPFPWKGMNDKLYGMRQREIITLTAGSGVGKSAVVRELEYHLLKSTGDNIGVLALEESVARTAWGIVSLEANLPLAIREERQGVAKEDIKGWYDATLGTNRFFTLDHFGSTSEANLLSRIRYMIKGLQCKWIFLDHLSIVVSAMEDMGDERKAIDRIMTNLRSLIEETGAGMVLVSHLKRVDGNKGHEQGVEVSLSHLRGSQSIAQLSDSVVAVERNQQALNEKEANLLDIRILKNRYAGLTGLAGHLAYNRATGRLEEVLDKAIYLAPSAEEAGC